LCTSQTKVKHAVAILQHRIRSEPHRPPNQKLGATRLVKYPAKFASNNQSQSDSDARSCRSNRHERSRSRKLHHTQSNSSTEAQHLPQSLHRWLQDEQSLAAAQSAPTPSHSSAPYRAPQSEISPQPHNTRPMFDACQLPSSLPTQPPLATRPATNILNCPSLTAVYPGGGLVMRYEWASAGSFPLSHSISYGFLDFIITFPGL